MAKKLRKIRIESSQAEKYRHMIGDIAQFSSESIRHSYQRIYQSLNIGMSRPRPTIAPLFNRDEVMTIVGDAWNIVDRFDTIHKIYRDPVVTFTGLSDPKSLSEVGKAASYLRNKMDHLSQNVFNLTKRKEKMLPFLGIVTAAYADIRDVVEQRLGAIEVALISASESHTELNITIDVKDHVPMQGPIDHIRLHAFDTRLDIGKANWHAENILERVGGSRFEDRLNSALKIAASEPFKVELLGPEASPHISSNTAP